MSRYLLASALCGCALFAAGCYRGETAPTEKTKTGDNGKTVWTGTESWKADYEVQDGDFAKLKKLIKEHEGKVVIVDFWATWCEPCVSELPHLAQLQKQYGDKVVCIAVNLDCNKKGDDELQQAKILKQVKKLADDTLRERFGKALQPDEQLNAAFVSFISSQVDEDFSADSEFEGVPTIWVISKTGKRTEISVDSVTKARPKKKRPGQNSAEYTNISYKLDVIPVVEKLLKE